MRPGQIHGANHAAVQASTVRAMAHIPRPRIITPPPGVIAQVVEELATAPPTAEELRVLTDMGTATDTLVVEKIEAQLDGTRLLELVRTLAAKSNISVSDCIVILLMIYQTYLMLHPKQPPAPTPPPAPQVTVNVTVPTPTVDTDEIVCEVEKRLEQEREATPEPSPGHEYPK